MKRYSISYLRQVGRHASKTGLQFHYEGRTDNPEETIREFQESELKIWKGEHHYWTVNLGIKITDSKTKEVVYCESRIQDASEIKELYESSEQHRVDRQSDLWC